MRNIVRMVVRSPLFMAHALGATLVSLLLSTNLFAAIVAGGPGYAQAVSGFFADDFSSPSLSTQFITKTWGVASIYVEDEKLVTTAGPALSLIDGNGIVALNRIFFPGQSFELSADLSIDGRSSGYKGHGLAILDPFTQQPISWILLMGETPFRYDVTDQVWVNEPYRFVGTSFELEDTAAFDFVDNTNYRFEIQYDANTQTISGSLDAAGYSTVQPLNVSAGFMIGIITIAGNDGASAITAYTDNINSDLEYDAYRVSYTPLTLVADGILYADPNSSDTLGGHPVYMEDGRLGLQRVTESDMLLQWDGITNVNALLITDGNYHSTFYSYATSAQVQPMLPTGTVIAGYVPAIFRARGPNTDYRWDDSGTPPNDWLPVSNRRGVILAVEPYKAIGGTEVTIYGFNFGWIPGAVWVGGISIQPNMWSDTRITFDLPAEVTAGNRTITVAPYTQLWASATFIVVPQISLVFPTDVTGGTTLYLSGTGFGDNPADGTVLIDNLPALLPLWSPYQLGALIPKTASPGDVTV